MRFPEFTSQWERYGNDSLFSCVSEKNKSKSVTDILSASQTDGMVMRNSLGIDIKFEEDSIKTYKIVRSGDYVIHLRSFQGGFAFSERMGVCSPAYTILRPNTALKYGFLRPYFMSNKFINSLKLVTYGIREGKSISVEEWLKLYTYIPEHREQEKISLFLSLLDERITTQNKIIEDLKKLKVAITQKISKDKSNKKVLLSELLTERCEKNKDLYPVHSVSVSEGVINQVNYLGRSFAANDISNYNVVYYGDIVYTKSPTGDFPYGIIKMNSINAKVSVSPLYGVYYPSSEYVGIYLHNYFSNSLNAKNYLHKLIQKGAKNTINITNKRFLENEISLPNETLLKEYSLFISTFDLKIKSEQKALLLLQKQKEYLLLQMFI